MLLVTVRDLAAPCASFGAPCAEVPRRDGGDRPPLQYAGYYFATLAAAATSETARITTAAPAPFRMLP